MKAALPPNEAQRLEALRQYSVLDTPAEESFDDLNQLAAYICGMPMSMVSLVDESRQWFKSKVGVSVTETPRDLSFCAHAILQPQAVMEVQDAQADPRFVDNPLVTGAPHIRFYAGAPLVTPEGCALGTLCVMDHAPRKLRDEQMAALRALSRQVVMLLKLRKKEGKLVKEAAERQQVETMLRQQFEELKTSKAEADRLLALGQKSRRAILSVLQDEKLAAQNLRKSEARFRELAATITDVFWMRSPDLKTMYYASPAYEQIWGHSTANLYADPHRWFEAIVPEERSEVLAVFARLMENEPKVSIEYRITRPDGAIRWIHDRGFQVRNEAGKLVRLTGIVSDITERKKAEEELRLLGSALQQSQESIIITDAELDLPGPKILFVNPAFTQMTGYPAQEVIGKTPRMLQGPRTDKSVLKRLRKNLEEGESFAGEAVNYRKDGTPFDLEWQIAPIRAASGKITHFVATQHDVTERRKLEAQFRQAQKMEGIGQLAGGVAHDFNNILAVIQMQSDLMKFSDGLSEEQIGYADEIINTVRSGAALTRQLLLFSRREVFQPRDLDLNESIAETTKMLKRMLGETIRMQLKLPSQPMFVHADSGMIDQILMNLVVNARDAMPNGGQLVIEAAGVEFDELSITQSPQMRAGSFVRLSVSDSGSGIPPEIITKIFEPFFTTKEVGKGTGLGLATVFGIVQQHQGWINVYSELKQGTTFQIYLPRLARSEVKNEVQPALADMRGGVETILVVEDDPKLRVAVRAALSRLGYRILEASTGVKAMEVWKQNRAEIRLVLTDLVMPDGMTGKDLAERILQDDPRMKIIYMSGYSADVVGKDFPLKEGVNFLTKPFQAVKLTETIRNCLNGV